MIESVDTPKTTQLQGLYKLLRLIISGITIGLVLGLFRLLIFSSINLFNLESKPMFLMIAFGLLILAQLLIHRHSILRGSGVPQVRSFMSHKRSLKPFQFGSLKLTAILLLNSIGFSIGSAGPSVFLGVCAGGLVTGKKTSEEGLISAYGGAGLAAFFSAPFSGLLLSIEELGLKRSLPALLQAVIVILSAWLTAFFITGRQMGLLKSEFSVNVNFTQFSILIVTVFIITILSTIAGYFFKMLLLRSPYLVTSRYKRIFLYLIPLLFLLLATRYPEISGGGFMLLKSLTSTQTFPFSMILIFVLLKFCFTLSCVSTNIPAGLFMPSLSIGGAIGALIFVASQSLIATTGLSSTLFIACGAACFFFILMRRPLLSAFISAELFGDYRLLIILLPIMIALHFILKRTVDRPLNDTLYDLID